MPSEAFKFETTVLINRDDGTRVGLNRTKGTKGAEMLEEDSGTVVAEKSRTGYAAGYLESCSTTRSRPMYPSSSCGVTATWSMPIERLWWSMVWVDIW